MTKKFEIRGLCACGHDPMEDPNEDCERCWLVTRISDLEIQAVEDADSLAALRERAGRLEEMASKLVEAGKCQYRDNRFGNLVEQAISISQALSTPAPAGEAGE